MGGVTVVAMQLPLTCQSSKRQHEEEQQKPEFGLPKHGQKASAIIAMEGDNCDHAVALGLQRVFVRACAWCMCVHARMYLCE